MQNILFPTDFTNATEPTLSWVRLFTRQFNAKLTVLHVYQPVVPDTTLPTIGDPGIGATASEELLRISQDNLSDLVAKLQADGLTVDAEWRVGAVEDEIIQVARDLNADLIITGRSDVTTFFDRLAGSAATDVAMQAPCPVLVVPTLAQEHEVLRPAQVKTVVYTTQLEFEETRILKQVVELVKVFETPLHVLKVKADNQPDVYDDAYNLAQFQRIFGTDQLQIETVKARGVTDGLLDYLAHREVDLLVMTTRERGFLDGLLQPSITERMLNRTSVPVLVYHDEIKR
ncbi:universal stress protein [Fibrisoma montanum]|uniref:Universal stress protein n=1 Tax=Fibrisoma montanum TaxID=2305895 RepID=A0A418M6T0_9BACT|nr:universal stress protein [Fibrisoma montanum]RIV21593.1 universal stress protein [Fibrisoma montanum]